MFWERMNAATQLESMFRSRVAMVKYMEAVGTYSQDDMDKASATSTS